MQNTKTIKPKFSQIITALENQFDIKTNDVFSSVGEYAMRLMEAKIVTLSAFDKNSGNSQRMYSSLPEKYPVSGVKPLNETWWTDYVIVKHNTFIANNAKEISEVFFDYKEIEALGCCSIINIPIVVFGDVIGTLNCLAGEQHFTQEFLLKSNQLKLPGSIAFLSNLYIKGLCCK